MRVKDFKLILLFYSDIEEVDEDHDALLVVSPRPPTTPKRKGKSMGKILVPSSDQEDEDWQEVRVSDQESGYVQRKNLVVKMESNRVDFQTR